MTSTTDFELLFESAHISLWQEDYSALKTLYDSRLGKHDPLARLRNRAFYVEELNRITRKGPWPLSILAMDLNGLKKVNDTQGHAAGNAMLRRMGEVLSKAAGDQPPIRPCLKIKSAITT